jgi:hypothetical protein
VGAAPRAAPSARVKTRLYPEKGLGSWLGAERHPPKQNG